MEEEAFVRANNFEFDVIVQVLQFLSMILLPIDGHTIHLSHGQGLAMLVCFFIC